MATYTFTAHDVNNVGGNINVVGSSTYTIVLTDDDSTIGDPGDTGEMVSINGGAPQPYTYLGTGTTDAGESMAIIEVNGVEYGFNLNGGTLSNGNTKVKFANLVDDPIVPCFTPGTMIMTPQGERAVETLRKGDLVTTRDHGAQPVVALLRRHVSGEELARNPHLRPIRIEASAAGRNMPKADLVVSPQHRFLVDDWRASVLFGEDEVLMSAKSMRNGESIRQVTTNAPVTYIHLVMERHEIIYASGMPTESVLLSHEFLGGQPLAVSCELVELFGGRIGAGAIAAQVAAAPILSGYEGVVLQASRQSL